MLLHTRYLIGFSNTNAGIGSARVVGSTSLEADLAREVEQMKVERSEIFGNSGAYAQVFSLYTSASAAGVLVGPAWTSFAYGDRGWTFLVSSLGLFSASAAVPMVRYSRDTFLVEKVGVY